MLFEDLIVIIYYFFIIIVKQIKYMDLINQTKIIKIYFAFSFPLFFLLIFLLTPTLFTVY